MESFDPWDSGPIGVKGEVVTYYLKGPTALGIRPVKKSSERNTSYSYKRAGIHHVAFSVETNSEVDEFYRLLRQKRVGFSTLHRNILDTVEATTPSSS